MQKKFEINRTKIKGGCQSGRKVVPNDSKSDLPLAFSERFFLPFFINVFFFWLPVFCNGPVFYMATTKKGIDSIADAKGPFIN